MSAKEVVPLVIVGGAILAYYVHSRQKKPKNTLRSLVSPLPWTDPLRQLTPGKSGGSQKPFKHTLGPVWGGEPVTDPFRTLQAPYSTLPWTDPLHKTTPGKYGGSKKGFKHTLGPVWGGTPVTDPMRPIVYGEPFKHTLGPVWGGEPVTDPLRTVGDQAPFKHTLGPVWGGEPVTDPMRTIGYQDPFKKTSPGKLPSDPTLPWVDPFVPTQGPVWGGTPVTDPFRTLSPLRHTQGPVWGANPVTDPMRPIGYQRPFKKLQTPIDPTLPWADPLKKTTPGKLPSDPTLPWSDPLKKMSPGETPPTQMPTPLQPAQKTYPLTPTVPDWPIVTDPTEYRNLCGCYYENPMGPMIGPNAILSQSAFAKAGWNISKGDHAGPHSIVVGPNSRHKQSSCFIIATRPSGYQYDTNPGGCGL